MTQSQQILDYLRKHPEGITPFDALQSFGCFRLGARIYDLKRRGHDIESRMETAPLGTKRYARYILRDKAGKADA